MNQPKLPLTAECTGYDFATDHFEIMVFDATGDDLAEVIIDHPKHDMMTVTVYRDPDNADGFFNNLEILHHAHAQIQDAMMLALGEDLYSRTAR